MFWVGGGSKISRWAVNAVIKGSKRGGRLGYYINLNG